MIKDKEHAYDESDATSIEQYAQGMIGKTFREIIDEEESYPILIREGSKDKQVKQCNKGKLGEIIEEHYFYYKCNNNQQPDFEKAGVELKVTPYKKNTNGRVVAKERLVITMIDYFKVVNEAFEESHLWKKAQLILIVYYWYKKEIKNHLDYRIDYVKLFSPSKQDMAIIRHDYEIIVGKIRAGKAHELSEADTMYLGAAPKSAKGKDRRKQPFSNELAKPRAFVLKNSYMTYVLNQYIIPRKAIYESIIKDDSVISFEEYVIKKIREFIGKDVEELCRMFQVSLTKKPKNLGALLCYKMLGITGNRAEEFEKANIVIKTIRVEENGKIKESMSFPYFKFKELVQEEWESSRLCQYLSETKFLFVVYRYNHEGTLVLSDCQFWNMPYSDLQEEVCKVWNRTKQVLLQGLQIETINGRNRDNFPKKLESPVCHVRPHAKDAQDTEELPDGRVYPKQCFWLNNTYILKQLNRELS